MIFPFTAACGLWPHVRCAARARPRLRAWRAVGVIAAGLIAAASLCAQATWTAVSSGTTRNLWGACHGGGQFVVVGEGGTILTSPDGAQWTPRISGTTAWLTSVAYGLGYYVAVGDAGTILYSRDAITWTGGTNGAPSVTPRINVVRSIGGSFLAYGEHDLALEIQLPPVFLSGLTGGAPSAPWWRAFAAGLGRYVVGGETGLAVLRSSTRFLGQRDPIAAPSTLRNVEGLAFDQDVFVAVGAAGAIVMSPDATTWTPRSSRTNANLHAVASFNNGFVAVGDGGTILTGDAAGAWVRRDAPTSELLLAVAAGNDNDVAIVVGGSGTILRSTATVSPPAILEAPAGATETVGGAAGFVVRASGSLPLSYQWYHDGAPVAGETQPWLGLPRLGFQDGGTYTVKVSNPAGSVTSAPALLSVLAAPPPLVDPTFHAAGAIDFSPTLLLPLPEGRILLGDAMSGRLLRLNADGSIDGNFRAPVFGGAAPPDSFLPAKAIEALALQSDGRILVAGGFTTAGSQPRGALVRLTTDGSIDASFSPDPSVTARSPRAIAVRSDGRILVANSSDRVQQLLPGGTLDPSFSSAPLHLTDATGRERTVSVIGVTLGPNGSVFVAAEYDVSYAPAAIIVSSGAVIRLKADGSVDPTFAAASTKARFLGMQPLPDGGLMLATRRAEFRYSVTEVRRYQADGSLDTSYPLIAGGTAHFFYSDGRLIYLVGNGPVRLTRKGAVDPTFTGGIGAPNVIARIADDRIIVAGAFQVYNGTAANHVARLNAVASEATNPPRILAVVPDKTTVHYGEPVIVRAFVTGSGPLTYDWRGPWVFNDPVIARTMWPTTTFAFTRPGENIDLTLTVRNTRGEAVSAPIRFTVLPDAPAILWQPTRLSAQTGRDAVLIVWHNDTSGEMEFDWRHDGVPLASEGHVRVQREAVFLTGVTAADAGSYTLTMRNVLGATVTTAPIVLTVDDTSRFTNLSTRAFVESGERLLVAGLNITGNTGRTVLIRGIGPGLAKFGVSSPLADPQVAVFNSLGQPRTLANNDDWDKGEYETAERTRAFAAVGAFPLDPGSKDAALVAILDPGIYTVQLTGKPGQSGQALLEVYEYDNYANPIQNLSSRTFVTPSAPAIAGLAVRGPVAKKILLRAAGPGLGAFGVAGTLANPRLRLQDATGSTIAADDDWETGNAAELRAAMNSAGAFPFAAGSTDAALLITVPPGNYTAIVEGNGGESGVVLIEAYEIP